MLRASAKYTGTEVDVRVVVGDGSGAGHAIEFGPELTRFAEAVARMDGAALARARQALLEAAGPAVLVDTAGVAANFQRMVRIADSTGIPIDDAHSEAGQQMRQALELSRYPGARNTAT